MPNSEGDRVMKALTLWQPWATLVAVGAKRIETRSWTTQYRGPMAIHAAVTRAGIGACYSPPIERVLEAYHYNRPYIFPHGQIIAICQLADVLPVEDVRSLVELQEIHLGDFRNGRYAWRLENVRRLPLGLPAKGRQRLWNWDYSGEIEAVQRMIGCAVKDD